MSNNNNNNNNNKSVSPTSNSSVVNQPPVISFPEALGNPYTCSNEGGNNSHLPYPDQIETPATYAKKDGKGATESIKYTKCRDESGYAGKKAD